MDAPPPITPIRAAGHTLLVGPGGDVIPVDLAGAEPAEAERRIAEVAGSGLTVAVQGHSATAAAAASAVGALVVVDGEGVRSRLERATALTEAGIPMDRLLVEVPCGLGSVPTSAIHQVTEAGFAVLVVLQAPDGSGSEATEGGQIGALSQVLALGVRAVRGVTPQRFRRVAAVVAAIADADHRGARR